MGRFREYTVAPALREKLKLMGLSVEDVCRMAREAAPYTHPEMRHRFEGYLLKLHDGVVLDVQRNVSETRRRLVKGPDDVKALLERSHTLLEKLLETCERVRAVPDLTYAEMESLVDDIEKQLKLGV